MIPTQAVILSQLLAFAIFWLAGDNAKNRTLNGLNKLRGAPTKAPATNETGPRMSVGVAAGWATLFIWLIVLTDIEATQELGVAFAWLIFLSMSLAFGPDAFANLTSILAKQPEPKG